MVTSLSPISAPRHSATTHCGVAGARTHASGSSAVRRYVTTVPSTASRSGHGTRGVGKNHAMNTASVSTLLNSAGRTGCMHEDRGADDRVATGTSGAVTGIAGGVAAGAGRTGALVSAPASEHCRFAHWPPRSGCHPAWVHQIVADASSHSTSTGTSGTNPNAIRADAAGQTDTPDLPSQGRLKRSATQSGSPSLTATYPVMVIRKAAKGEVR